MDLCRLDAETAARFAAIEREVEALRRRLEGRARKPIYTLKAAALDTGMSDETIRRWALEDATLGRKIGGQWEIDAAQLARRVKR
jgi:hypothetical protein